MILSGQSIRARCLHKPLGNLNADDLPMIAPFHERSREHGMTYGVGPAGYDVRIDENYIIPAGGFVLAATVEKFAMPNDILATVHDKSTWARLGLACQTTVIEPGWRGHLTIELTNHSQITLPIQAGCPIVQIIFHVLDRETNMAYAGKYQDQKAGPQEAIIEQ